MKLGFPQSPPVTTALQGEAAGGALIGISGDLGSSPCSVTGSQTLGKSLSDLRVPM